MRSILRFLQAPYASIASGCLLALVPLAALAAEQLVRAFEPSGLRFWVTLAAVQILWFVGYAASSLPAWAKWPDGTVLDRLTIIQGVVTGALAGNICYYGGLYYLDIAEVACFIGTGLAGFGGDKFVSPLLSRLHAALDAFTGSGGPGANDGGGAKP